MTYAETDLVTTIDRLLGPPAASSPLTPDGLDGLDHFHVGDADAVDRLVTPLALGADDTILDVGSGFGGPARQIASDTGCRVVGVDITPAYVEAARQLTERCGLVDRVQFVRTDVADLAAARPFDVAVTMHVQMNVADEAAWFGAIASLVAPSGRLAVWEVCRTGEVLPPWPMPWSLDGTDSQPATPDGLLAAIRAGGFACLEWVDETAWINTWFEAALTDGPAARSVLPMLLDDGFTRMVQFAGALADGTLSVRRGLFARTA